MTNRCGVFDFLGRQCNRPQHHAEDHVFFDAERTTDFNLVGSFHRKFGLPIAGESADPHVISRDVAAFRWRFLMEEMGELLTAMNRDDLPGIADALVDLVYVALGTAHYYGLPWEDLFAEVQRANMTKERAASDGSNSKRSSALDVIKPPGWQPPQLAPILERYGWTKEDLDAQRG